MMRIIPPELKYKWKTCAYFVEREFKRGMYRCSWINDQEEMSRIERMMPPVYYVKCENVPKAIAYFDCPNCNCYKKKEIWLYD